MLFRSTHLQFNARGELPALFVRNDDGSESLLNFSIEDGDVLIHRVDGRRSRPPLMGQAAWARGMAVEVRHRPEQPAPQALIESPSSFRRRGVFITSGALDRA